MAITYSISDKLDSLNLKCGVIVKATVFDEINEVKYTVTQEGKDKLTVLLSIQKQVKELTGEN